MYICVFFYILIPRYYILDYSQSRNKCSIMHCLLHMRLNYTGMMITRLENFIYGFSSFLQLNLINTLVLFFSCSFLIQVVVDNGKSERITVADNSNRLSGQHAVTDYRVIASSPSGSFLTQSSNVSSMFSSMSYLLSYVHSKACCLSHLHHVLTLLPIFSFFLFDCLIV